MKWVQRKKDYSDVKHPLLHLVDTDVWRHKDCYGYIYDRYSRVYARLWWNGARWVAWVPGVLTAQMTEFRDKDNPPKEWAEALVTLTRSD